MQTATIAERNENSTQSQNHGVSGRFGDGDDQSAGARKKGKVRAGVSAGVLHDAVKVESPSIEEAICSQIKASSGRNVEAFNGFLEAEKQRLLNNDRVGISSSYL